MSPTAERAVEDRELELREVQRIAKVGGVIVYLDGKFRNHRSPEYLEIHGLPPEAVNETHEDWVRRIHPEDRERTEAQFLDAVKGSASRYSSEYRIIRPRDGEVRWIAVEARIDRDSEGAPLRLVGAHIDITDRALARELLRESEQRFKRIADSAPIPMWVTQLDRKRSFANAAYVKFIGVPYDEALAFDWRKILHPEDLDRIVGESIAGEAALKPFVLEGRYRRADGEWRWIRSESQPRWDPSGQHIGFIGIAHDITTAKLAELELKTQNDRLEDEVAQRTTELRSRELQLRTILETTNQYQILLDSNGCVVYANATALSAISTRFDDISGDKFWLTPWFANSPELSDKIEIACRAAIVGIFSKLETQLLLVNGARNIDFALRPVLNSDGSVTAILAEGVDSTDARRNEEALRQSQKVEAVGQLTGGVAHDFNNLLTIIRSAVDFLKRPDLPEDRRQRYINAISETTSRASNLTSQLLAFARRQPLRPVSFDVTEQIEDVLRLIQPLVGSRIIIDLDVIEGPHFVHADTGQFDTALINLAVNARDAMSGEGRLTISISAADEIPTNGLGVVNSGPFIAIAVRDTGKGIPSDQIDLVFEPFFTTKDVGQGTGLGLSQVFGFVKQSGGDLSVQSEVNVGSCFTLYLPRSTSVANRISNVADIVSPLPSGLRILVVEDNQSVGEFSTALLHDLGCDTEWVQNGDDALQKLENCTVGYDAVFSDVIMPGINGVDLATKIREHYPELPVILTSGYSDVLASETTGDFILIRKPYSVDLIAEALRKAIVGSVSSQGHS